MTIYMYLEVYFLLYESCREVFQPLRQAPHLLNMAGGGCPQRHLFGAVSAPPDDFTEQG